MRAEQYNLHEPRRPITGLQKGQDRQQTTDNRQTADRVGDMKKAFCTSYSCLKQVKECMKMNKIEGFGMFPDISEISIYLEKS